MIRLDSGELTLTLPGYSAKQRWSSDVSRAANTCLTRFKNTVFSATENNSRVCLSVSFISPLAENNRHYARGITFSFEG